jgi:hypothetical protein
MKGEVNGRVKGKATPQERMAIGAGLIEVLKEMNLDDREQISVLFVALMLIWKNQRLPVSMFDKMAAHVRQTIHENSLEVA